MKEVIERKTVREANAKVSPFLQDTAPHRADKMMNILKSLRFKCIDHPHYSSDLATSDTNSVLKL